jgi:hypothetical protein
MPDSDAGRCTRDQPFAGAGQSRVGGVKMQALAVSAQVPRLCTGRVAWCPYLRGDARTPVSEACGQPPVMGLLVPLTDEDA